MFPTLFPKLIFLFYLKEQSEHDRLSLVVSRDQKRCSSLEESGDPEQLRHFQCFGTQMSSGCDSQVYVVSENHLIDLTGIHVRFFMYFRRKISAVALQCLGANTNLKLVHSEMSSVVKDRKGFAGGIIPQNLTLKMVLHLTIGK